MRISRKLAIGVAIALAVVLLALIVVPFAFRGRIESRLRTAVNDGVDAHVNWRGVSLSLLRDFPAATLTLDEPSVVGVGAFAGDTLVVMNRARLALDLGSVVGYLRHGAPIVVREVSLDRPRAHLRVLPDGTANWQITRPSAPSKGESKPVSITLRSLRITAGALRLDDQHAKTTASVDGLDETLSGDFAKERFRLVTRTRADSVSFSMAGVPYLTRVAVAIDADVDADMAAHRFTLRDDTLRLNALAVGFGGTITTGSPNIGLDVAFKAPGTSFRDILSLVPAIYAHDFAQLQASGTMALSGQARGAYGPHAFPQLALRATVANGAFRYSSLPLGASDVALDLAVTNPGGNIDSTVVALEKLHAVIGGRPLDAHIAVRTPISDPDIDLAVTGGLDLGDLARTVKLTGVRSLAGRLSADFAVHARQSDLDVRRADRVAARGSLDASRIAVTTDSLPRGLHVDTAAIRFTPAAARLAAFAARYGSSDVQATGSLDNFVGYLVRGQELRGTAAVTSHTIDLDELVPQDTTSTQVVPVPAHVDFTLSSAADRVKYGKIVATGVRGGLRIKDQRITLTDLRMRMLGGGVMASGWYETVNPAKPAFDVTFGLDSLDLASAYATLVTVQKLAPVAKWAHGNVSGATTLAGTLGHDMTPDFASLTGNGTVASDNVALSGVPLLGKVADATSLDLLRNPALKALRASFTIADGRVAVRPFSVDAAGITLTVSGSHGFDQSLRYDLGLAVPRAMAGAGANDAIAKLAARAGTPAAALAQAPVARLAAKVTGTVTDPKVAVDFAGMASSAKEAVSAAVQQQVGAAKAAVTQKVDSAADAARRRAREEADRMVAAATRQADSIRAAARTLAASINAEANARADSLVAKASNPLAKRAAEVAADRARKEANKRADDMVKEADARADALVAEARKKADALAPPKP